MTEIMDRKTAISLGAKKYYTGKPCPRGHICDRYVDKATCVECSKAASKNWMKNNKERVNARVKKSYLKNADKMRKRARDWYWENTEKARETNKRSYANDRDRRIAKNREWKKNNPEKVKAAFKDWCKNNPEKMKEFSRNNAKKHAVENRIRASKWRSENIERANERVRIWNLENPEKRRAHRYKREAIKRAADGSFTSEDIKRIYKMQNGKCPYCGIKLKMKYEIDHIIALSKGGSNYANNIQLLCTNTDGNSCNQSKSAKDPIDFARSRGFLL